MFKDWGKGTEPPDWVTKEECQEMIDNVYENIIVTLVSSVCLLDSLS